VPTEIVPLTPALLPALLRFAERVWQRPDRPEYRTWRYEEPAFHSAFVAMRDGECLAAESAFRHPYRVGDEVVEFLEVFDWFSLPELRNAGLGVRIMQRFMKEPEPLLLLGGTADTQGLLPRLGWKVVDRATRWILPLGVDRTAAALARRGVPRPLADVAAPIALWASGRRPRRRRAPPGGRAIAVAMPGAELFALQRGPLGYGTAPIWSPELLRWLVAGFAGIGHFVPIEFFAGDALRGFALLRIYPAAAGGRDAEVVDLFAPAPDADLYDWMLAEVVAIAAGFGAGGVGLHASCPAIVEAVRRHRFVAAGSSPIQVWWPGRETLPGPILLGSNTGDSPILPLVSSW
jgi:hypothetical protein